MRILDLGKVFRQATSIVYPPFKHGRYMEEYAYEYFTTHAPTIDTPLVYLAAFWTNLQIHPAYDQHKANYQMLLDQAIAKELEAHPTTRFFTVIQHDDGVTLRLPPGTIYFGGCTGDIPLPLIYEDTTNRLPIADASYAGPKKHLASFVGSNTHHVRREMNAALAPHSDIVCGLQGWTNQIGEPAMQHFVQTTLLSRFCLAPRGYGRSSFRFFEAMLLHRIPVYFWDDVEWLPYKDELDYSTFAVSIHRDQISKTYEILAAITPAQYDAMIQKGKEVAHRFTLEGMCEYIVRRVVAHANL
jgi:hypothetical protein